MTIPAMTQYNPKTYSALFIMVLAVLLLSAPSEADIIPLGSFSPNPLHSGDGIVTREMRLGETFNSTCTLSVTDGDTLRTKQSSTVGSAVGSEATVTLTDSTWITESAVLIAQTSYTEGTVVLNNSIWTVQSNLAIAQGENSVGEVTLNGGSTWTVNYASRLTRDKNCTATININDGTWNAIGQVQAGGLGFTNDCGSAEINIKADGVMECRNGLNLTEYGTVDIDGGILSLFGTNTFNGLLQAEAAGGTIRLEAATNPGFYGLIALGPNAFLAGLDVEIYFNDSYTPNSFQDFNVFDALPGLDLPSRLATANTISSPAGWELDYDTGIMSYTAVPEPSAFAMIALMAMPFIAMYYRRRRVAS